MEQYIKEKEIMTVIVLDEKTPNENDMVEVTFVDGTKEIMPKMRFELIATEEPSDASTMQQTVIARVASLCYGTLHEYGIKMGEVNGIMDAVTSLVNEGFTRAQDIMWKADYLNIPLINVNKVLLDERNKNNTDGAASSGSGTDTENKE